MAHFKGTIYNSTALFADERFGPEARDRIIAELPPADQELLQGVTAIGWYPSEPIMAFHHKLDELYGQGDLALCVQAGKFSAEWTLNSVLKVFLRFRKPNWLMERSSSLWSQFHDSGRWEILERPDIPMLARLHDFKVRDAAFCARFCGWLHGAIQLTGGREPDVRHTACVCKGADYCQFDARWR